MRCAVRIAVFLLAIAAPVAAMADPLRTIDVRIPFASTGSQGLEAVIVEPAAPGHYPLAILNNGSPRSESDRPAMKARDMLPQALQFARRGYVAVSLLRRGYGTSGGGWAETYGSCAHADYAAAGRAGASDIKAAILGSRVGAKSMRRRSLPSASPRAVLRPTH